MLYDLKLYCKSNFTSTSLKKYKLSSHAGCLYISSYVLQLCSDNNLAPKGKNQFVSDQWDSLKSTKGAMCVRDKTKQ